MISKMKLSLAAAALSLIATASAQAIVVTYTTVGAFGAIGGSNVINSGGPGGITITFDALDTIAETANVDLGANNPSFAGYGRFIVTGLSTAAVPFSTSFFLTITQSAPTSTNPTQTFGTATLSGTISAGSSGVSVVFNPNPGDRLNFNLNGANTGTTIQYRVNEETFLSPPSTDTGVTTLGGNVRSIATPGQTNTVPLPASVWGGIGTLAVLGGLQLRRKLAAK